MPNAQAKMPYRPDIDGLRAWAVLLVLAFHYFAGIFPGGFMGVDIFFVISGYLISGIIIDSLHNGTFSFRHFYARRALRIFPALIVALLGMLAAGWFLLLPDELKHAGKYIAGGAAFVDNFLLMQESGYFAPASHGIIFLNLWSLGIEEQFYIFFPVFLWLCWKCRVSIPFAILAIAALSFAYNFYMAFGWGKTAHIFMEVDFYSPLTRAWELMLGAHAQCMERRAAINCGQGMPDAGQQEDKATLSALSGFFFLAIGYFVARPDLAWPGINAIWPAGGTFFLLLANPANLLSRFLLANRPAVFIGKISYPLYLWHWPLLAFAVRLQANTEPVPVSTRLILLALSFMLAIATYFFIERPLRFRRVLGRGTIPALCGGIALAFFLGLACYETGGFPERASIKTGQDFLGRFEPEFLPLGSNRFSFGNLKAAVENIARKHRGIFPEPEEYSANAAGLKIAGTNPGDLQYCVYFDAGAPDTVAIVGDSHGSIAFPLARIGLREHFNTFYLGRLQPGMEGTMSVQKDRIHSILAKMPDVKDVVIVCRGPVYMTGLHNKGELWEKSFPIPGGAERYAKDLENFVEALLKMGKRVAILPENPELDINPKALIERRPFNFRIKKDFPAPARQDVLARQGSYLDLLGQLAQRPGVAVLDSMGALCPGESCKVKTAAGASLYYDDDHLSSAGNAFLADKVVAPWILAGR